MAITTVDASLFRSMIQAGYNQLHQNAEYVNKLNVFPVPDGDTGTNMNLTMESGAKAVNDSTSDHVGELGQCFAKGLLMGARGNSGVILSQLFRGFSKQIESEEALTAQSLADAFTHGVEVAYKAVMKPVEGTILTVAREAAKAGQEAVKTTDDCEVVMQAVVNQAKVALEHTPEQLPVLKEVGVVDSGGQGLLFVYEGFLAGLTGKEIAGTNFDADVRQFDEFDKEINIEHKQDLVTDDIKYGYCTEIMVSIGDGPTVEEAFDYDTFRNFLNEIGDSLLVVADDEIIKVHVHTEEPGTVLNYGLKFGSLIKVKVDNMRKQNEEAAAKREEELKANEHLPYGVIAVAAGDGIAKMFKGIGVNEIISGGQTMNPSTEDIIKAINKVNADQVILLPNNKNILMAAEQAAEVTDIPTVVIPTKTISQGISAMFGFDENATLAQNEESMIDAMSQVKSGQVAVSIRDTEIDGLAIHKDDFIGMIDGKIVVDNANLQQTVLNTLTQMIDADSEIVTLIVGEEGTQKEAENIANELENKYPDIEVEIYEGNQPVYPYLFSVE